MKLMIVLDRLLLLALMEKFKKILIFKLSDFIFSITEQLPITLQRVNTNANHSFVAVHVTIRVLTSIEVMKSSKHYL